MQTVGMRILVALLTVAVSAVGGWMVSKGWLTADQVNEFTPEVVMWLSAGAAVLVGTAGTAAWQWAIKSLARLKAASASGETVAPAEVKRYVDLLTAREKIEVARHGTAPGTVIPPS